jgi:hypothetical protein
MLDRTKTAPRSALGLVSEVHKTGKIVGDDGVDLNEFSMSVNTVIRSAKKNRRETADGIFKDFLQNKPEFGVFHWDGKLVDNFLDSKDEKLAILLSGAPDYCEGKLLSIPSLVDEDGDATSTGVAQAEACWSIIQKYGLEDNIVGFTFDTTSSNTGCNRGAVKLLEDKLGRPVLHFGCRHHFPELIVKAAWYEIFDEDLSPDNKWFVEFKEGWTDLDIHPATPVRKLDQVMRSRQLRGLKTEAVESLMETLTHRKKSGLLPRDDYKEVAELALIILGEMPPGGISWKKPGATHKARFLNYAIYVMKMYMFSSMMGYSKEVINGLQRMATFISLIYAPFFLNASMGVDAPFNDLNLYKQLFVFQLHDQVIGEKSLEVLGRHGWYLDQTTVPFALFSSKLSSEEKMSFATEMLKHEPEAEDHRFEIKKTVFPDVTPDTKLEDLVGERSFLVFSLLKVSYSWLSEPQAKWSESPGYNKIGQFVNTAKTVNDVAERAVKLMTDYAKILTKDDEMRQMILQGVAENRKKFSNLNKKTLNK